MRKCLLKKWCGIFTLDETQRVHVGLLVHGEPYRLLGVLDTDLHLFGPLDSSQPMYLLGADRLGRDVLSRVMYGARISLSMRFLNWNAPPVCPPFSRSWRLCPR